jgi:hypothetical protein
MFVGTCTHRPRKHPLLEVTPELRAAVKKWDERDRKAGKKT